ncbi:MAG: Uma2 family endonuclease [Synechococcaceae cyanobacterium SM2_3_2]|nr:Uma2 family endonuclease [Synechococcaceae cyanobacterium SM2_3_2]
MVSTQDKVESKAGSPPVSLSEATQKAWTDAEFMALPDDGNRYEVVNGELVVMGTAGARHGYYVALMSFFLTAYAREQKAGIVFDSDTSFKMKSGNRRSPDCSFFSKERIKSIGGIPTGYIEGSPDLAVEILSPGNTVEEIHGKIVEYFENGSRLVWIIHPDEQYVLVYHQPQPDQFKRPGDLLDGGDVIPGFTLDLADFFPEPEI